MAMKINVIKWAEINSGNKETTFLTLLKLKKWIQHTVFSKQKK